MTSTIIEDHKRTLHTQIIMYREKLHSFLMQQKPLRHRKCFLQASQTKQSKSNVRLKPRSPEQLSRPSKSNSQFKSSKAWKNFLVQTNQVLGLNPLNELSHVRFRFQANHLRQSSVKLYQTWSQIFKVKEFVVKYQNFTSSTKLKKTKQLIWK